MKNEFYLHNKRFVKEIDVIYEIRTPDTHGGKIGRIKYSPVYNPKIVTWMFMPPSVLKYTNG